MARPLHHEAPVRLVAKFALAFFLATIAVVGAFTFLAVKRQVARIENTAIVDLQNLGAGLRAAIQASWQAEGEAEAIAIVDAANGHRSDVDIRWVSGLSTSDVDAVSERRTDGEHEVEIVLPVRTADGRGGTLVLTRTLPSTGTLLLNELGDEILLAVVLAVVMAGVAVGLGVVLFGRPLERIVDQARRVGAGDFSQRLRQDRTDELGILKREFNAMCDKLVAAQKRVDDEAASRLETLEQLRHLDRLRTVGTMASSIAHELGTPLNVVLLRGQSLARGEATGDEVADAGKTIVAQVEKMSRIVRQMLDFSRPKDEARERVSARALVDRTMNLLVGIAKKHAVVTETSFQDDGAVLGRPSELEQALTNLVMNAIQAMKAGGKLVLGVRVGDAEPPRALMAEAGARAFPAVMIDVRDEGPGMDDATIGRIFEPFYTTKRSGEGTGLGLGVASGIAEDHGGFITASSTPGKGSTFTITLPRVP
jgi:signal transduction histidine kinase